MPLFFRPVAKAACGSSFSFVAGECWAFGVQVFRSRLPSVELIRLGLCLAAKFALGCFASVVFLVAGRGLMVSCQAFCRVRLAAPCFDHVAGLGGTGGSLLASICADSDVRVQQVVSHMLGFL